MTKEDKKVTDIAKVVHTKAATYAWTQTPPAPTPPPEGDTP